jgi:hypothetical protein
MLSRLATSSAYFSVSGIGAPDWADKKEVKRSSEKKAKYFIMIGG